MTSNLDLNIDNYEVTDIFNLFDVNPLQLDEAAMKKAKMKVLKTHPDKSKYSPEIFLFFKKAYDRLLKIYEFRHASNTKQTTYVPTEEFDKSLKITASKMSTKEFNTKFNKLFEQCKYVDEETETGYSDWLKSDDGVYDGPQCKNTRDMESILQQKRNALVVHREVDYLGSGGCSLLKTKPQHYGSDDPFSKLQYDDVKRAYTETNIIAVDMNERRQHYNSVDEYARARSQVILPTDSHQQILRRNEMEEQMNGAKIAFELAKQSEIIQERMNQFSGAWKMLT